MIQNAIIVSDACTVSVTGGTNRTLSQAGPVLANGVHVIDTSITDFRVQPTFDFVSRQPVLNSDGTYVKSRRSCHIVRPKLLASGKYETNSGDVIMKMHPESTAAEFAAMKKDLIQAIIDSDFDNFWQLGTTA